jgi:alkylation response protein AidB-like acyl-CoA dehydrogenase
MRTVIKLSPFYQHKHEEWRSEVRSFAETFIQPLASELDKSETFSVDLTRQMGEAGFLGIEAPVEFGGKGLDALSYIVAVEEIARIDGSQAATVAAHNSLGVAPIYQFGTAEQKKMILPDLCSGNGLWAFGLTETNAGSDAKGVETIAREEHNNWVINGTKRYITNGSSELLKGVTLLVVSDHPDGKKELSTILVPRNTNGFTTNRMLGKMMWRASDTAEMNFSNVRVPYSNLLGVRGHGLQQMLKTLDSGRLSIAAMGLGLAQGAFEMAAEYAGKRKQFGNEIGRYQSVSFKLADMALKIELARNTLYNACWLKDHGQPFGKEAAMAKLYCSEIAKEVADEAVQIFGGAGLFQSSAIERFYRDQRILQIGEGTSDILRMVIGRYLGIVN